MEGSSEGPDPIAITDQHVEQLRQQVAPAVGGYFKALVEEQGFKRMEALQLTMQYQACLLGMFDANPDEPPE